MVLVVREQAHVAHCACDVLQLVKGSGSSNRKQAVESLAAWQGMTVAETARRLVSLDDSALMHLQVCFPHMSQSRVPLRWRVFIHLAVVRVQCTPTVLQGGCWKPKSRQVLSAGCTIIISRPELTIAQGCLADRVLLCPSAGPTVMAPGEGCRYVSTRRGCAVGSCFQPFRHLRVLPGK